MIRQSLRQELDDAARLGLDALRASFAANPSEKQIKDADRALATIGKSNTVHFGDIRLLEGGIKVAKMRGNQPEEIQRLWDQVSSAGAQAIRPAPLASDRTLSAQSAGEQNETTTWESGTKSTGARKSGRKGLAA